MKLLFTFILLSSLCFGQSKKEQIEILANRVDSLNTVLQATRDKASQQITELNAIVDGLNTEISELKKSLSELKSSVANLEKDKSKLTLENEKLKAGLDEVSRKNNIEVSLKPFKINEGDYAGETQELPIIKINNNPELEKIINEEIFLRFNLLQSNKFDPVFGFEKFVGNANPEFRKITTLWYFFGYKIFTDGEGKFVVEYFGQNFELIRYFLTINNDGFELNFDRRYLDDPNREH